jgi:ParB family chromosome partitioning protein
MLRLLSLAEPVKNFLREGRLEMGHAKILIPLSPEQQIEMANKIIAQGLTVRKIEVMVRNLHQQTINKAHTSKIIDHPLKATIPVWEKRFSEKLGAEVHVVINRKGKGRVIMTVNSVEEIEQLFTQFK